MIAEIGKSYPVAESGWAAAAAASSVAAPRVGYQQGQAFRAASGMSQELAAYWPGMTSGDSSVLPALRLSLDRARDLVRNDPHAGAAVDRLVDMLVGSGWTLVATPDHRALGMDRRTAREIGRIIRSEWRLYARDPRRMADKRRRLSVNGLFRQAARTLAVAGEACVALGFRPEGRARYRTCATLIDPDRLCNPNNAADTRWIRGGVEFDRDGAAAAYHVREVHIADWWAAPQAMTWTRIPRETAWGRPVFIHAFEGDREDQTRAVTAFASLVSRLRMLGKFADTELANATANALIAATVESDLPAQEIADRLAAAPSGASVRASYVDRVVQHYTDHPFSLGGVRIPVMLPGSKVSMNAAPRQTTAFPSFQTAFLRSIAARLGLSYEQLSVDWSQTNYSSARAALNEVWRTVKRMQAVFGEQFVQPFYMAWLEDAFDLGRIPGYTVEDFWANPEAWTACRWIGPGRGYIDPVKEAEAASLRMETMTSTLELECAEQGLDHIDVLDEIELENEELEERGLSRISVVQAFRRDRGQKTETEEVRGGGQS